MITPKRAQGDWGEEKAVEFLLKKGYDIVTRNFRVKMGELDAVAWHKKHHFGMTLCFIEVKTRGENDGSAERATQGKKMPRLLFTAKQYCLAHGIRIDTVPIQFEQVSVFPNGDGAAEMKHDVIPID